MPQDGSSLLYSEGQGSSGTCCAQEDHNLPGLHSGQPVSVGYQQSSGFKFVGSIGLEILASNKIFAPNLNVHLFDRECKMS